MNRQRSADVLLAAGAELAEGPLWDPRRELLLWVDGPAELVHALTLDGDDTVRAVGTFVGCVALRRSGGLVLTTPRGFAVLDEGDGEARMTAPLDTDPDMRMNDGWCDPDGRFWASTISTRRLPHSGSLYCLEPDDRVRAVLSGLSMGNGIGFSPDGRTMYLVDSLEHCVDAIAFDSPTGALGERRRFLDVPEGLPDGLAVDCDGCVWLAIWGTGQVRRYAADGRLLETVQLPTRNVTSCAFGGSDLQTLVITSAGDRGGSRLAGALFALQVPSPGLPVPWFEG